jgi:hypothetical protein
MIFAVPDLVGSRQTSEISGGEGALGLDADEGGDVVQGDAEDIALIDCRIDRS